MPAEFKSQGEAALSWTIRPMRQEDIEKCLAIWKRVELTEAHLTVSSTLATDPNCLYVAELDSTGEYPWWWC